MCLNALLLQNQGFVLGCKWQTWTHGISANFIGTQTSNYRRTYSATKHLI
uniref:Uncharacterized protein n=1 Tax=Arundo donax TaxID=35708 RepID=A0A0A8Y1N9_ARUDO